MENVVPKSMLSNDSSPSKNKFDFADEINLFYNDINHNSQINHNQAIRSHENKRELLVELRDKIESKCLIEVKNNSYLQDVFEANICKASNSELTKIKPLPFKSLVILEDKHEPEEIMNKKEIGSFKSDKEKIKIEEKKDTKMPNISKAKESEVNRQVNLEKESNLSFGDKNDEKENSSKYSDELEDKMGDMGLFGNIPLKKIRTAVPENLKIKANFQDEIDDFLGDPLNQPLPKVNAFSKHKSEMVKPIGGIKSFGISQINKIDNKDSSEIDATKKIKQE